MLLKRVRSVFLSFFLFFKVRRRKFLINLIEGEREREKKKGKERERERGK